MQTFVCGKHAIQTIANMFDLTVSHVVLAGPTISSAGASIEISEEVLEAIALVRADENPTKWMVAEYQ